MTKNIVLDPNTGQPIPSMDIRHFVFPPSVKVSDIRTIEEAAGKSPRWLNLKDHSELDGVTIAILGVEFMPGNSDYADKDTGEVRDYVRLAAVILDNDGAVSEPVVIYTGASQIVERIMAISEGVSPDNPVKGTLRAVGSASRRAWLIE